MPSVAARLTAGLLFAALTGAADGAIVRFKESGRAGAAVVVLGDVADVIDVDPAIVAELEGVTLMPAPAGGREAWIDHATIRERLQAHGANLAGIEFSGRNAVRVTSNSTPSSRPQSGRTARTSSSAVAPDAAPPISRWKADRAERIVAAAVQESLKRSALDAGEVRVEATIAGADADVLLGAAGCSVRSLRWPADDVQSITLVCRDARGAERELRVNCRVTPLPTVLAVRHTVSKGQVVQAADLVWTQSESAEGVALSPDQVVGREVVRTLRPGSPIRNEDVQQVPLVRSGDLVTLVARRSGISVRRVVKSRSVGALGETVTLVSLDGRETVVARVTGYHEAETVAADSVPVAPSAPTQFQFLPSQAGS